MPTKHTPGPWEVDGTKAFGAYGVWTAYGTHPGDVPGELYPDMICSMRPQDTLGTQEQRDANARLIAAAPDLLEACESIAGRDLTYFDGFVMAGQITREEVQALRAAIAKAKEPA